MVHNYWSYSSLIHSKILFYENHKTISRKVFAYDIKYIDIAIMVSKKNKVLDIKRNDNKFDLGSNTNLETDDEKTARIRSLWVMNIESFIFALSFSIVITGVLPYLRQVNYLIS